MRDERELLELADKCKRLLDLVAEHAPSQYGVTIASFGAIGITAEWAAGKASGMMNEVMDQLDLAIKMGEAKAARKAQRESQTPDWLKQMLATSRN